MTTLLTLSLRYRVFTLIVLGLVVMSGISSLSEMPVDAVPDLTPVQVQILTRAPAFGPVEVEQFVTFPIETALGGLPGLRKIRSVSRYGISAITVIFDDGIEPYFARQLVSERLTIAKDQIPSEYAIPMMGPLTTGLGEVYQFTISGDGYSPMELRTLLEWDVARRLRAIAGVVEVNIWGGEDKQYQVVVDPQKLLAFDLSLANVFQALERNHALAGGGYIEHERELFLIRGEALAKNAEDLLQIVIDRRPGGVPILIQDVAEVKEGAALRVGSATAMGKGETVIGMVQMLAGENATQVVARVKAKIEEIQASLPSEIKIKPYYDRTIFVSQVMNTVRNNLLEGGLLVVAILFSFLGNLRAGFIVASAIPLSMLFAFTGMAQAGISGNLMSLGAIDFGLLVDGSVVMIDNILRRVGELNTSDRKARLAAVEAAAREILRPIVFAVGIIILVYIPILTLTGVEGTMFQPMATTVIFALIGSLLFAVMGVPVLAYLIARSGRSNITPWIMRSAQRIYQPCLRFSIKCPTIVTGIAVATFMVSLGISSFLGVAFMPRLDEGDIAIQVWRLPSIAMSESVRTALELEKQLRQFPEVVQVVTRTGSPDVATDVMGIELSDVFVVLKPRSEWTSATTRDGLIEAMKTSILKAVPGIGLAFTQPIEMRFNELISGSRADVAIKVYGEDLTQLQHHADTIAQIVEKIAGAEDISIERVSGVPRIRVVVDRSEVARYGITARAVLDIVESARVGKVVGMMFEGQRRFELVVRLIDDASAGPAALRRLLIPTPHGALVPLSRLAAVHTDEGPAQVSREDNQRLMMVEINLRGRDLGGFVKELKMVLNTEIHLPLGYYLELGGQFEHLEHAFRRLAFVIPTTLIVIFGVLTLIFGTLRPALLIFLNVPLALSGGILALWLRGLPLSISAAIGFIALFGIAVLNGVVLVSHIRNLQNAGQPLDDAVIQGATDRLRPVLMTALVASVGFLPMAAATSMGAEVQRPLATVVIGGLITSTALTLLIIPGLYRWFCPATRRPDENDEQPLATAMHNDPINENP